MAHFLIIPKQLKKQTNSLTIMKISSILCAIVAFVSFHSFAQTTIPDNTSINGNWTVANSPYIVEGRAIIPNDQSLTIEPGVEIRLKSSASPTPSWFDYGSGNIGVIRVQGELIADGTASNPIVFTRDNTGFWGTILIDENAASSSSISNCVIEYAKESRNVTGITSPVSFNGGVSVYKSSISIHNNEFRNNNLSGLYINGVNTSFDFSENTFHNNGSNGNLIEESTVNAINNTYFNNSNNATGQVSAIHSSNSTVYLVGNLIYNNDDFGIFTTDGGNHHIVNNTIFGNSQGIRVENGANTFIHNSIIQNNTLNFATSNVVGATVEMEYSSTDDASFPTNVTDVSGNLLDTDVFFVNSGANDFSLQSNSPGIDVGNPDLTGLNVPTNDLLGNNRIDNSIIDLGAIEFQQPVIPDFTVSTSANPTIGGNTTGDGTFASGTEVTVSATTNPNYVFVNWTENGTVASSSDSYTFTLSSDRDLIANFEAIEYSVTTSPNPTAGGSTSGEGTYTSGTEVTVSASPNSGYAFVNWTDNGTVLSNAMSYSFTLTSDRSLVANFELTSNLTENQIDESEIAIFPNPSNGLVQIKAADFSSVEVYTVLGKFILSTSEKVIDFSTHPAGVYLFKIKSLNGLETTKRIIKN